MAGEEQRLIKEIMRQAELIAAERDAEFASLDRRTISKCEKAADDYEQLARQDHPDAVALWEIDAQGGATILLANASNYAVPRECPLNVLPLTRDMITLPRGNAHERHFGPQTMARLFSAHAAAKERRKARDGMAKRMLKGLEGKSTEWLEGFHNGLKAARRLQG
ncbi:MAG: hypothetical protein AABW54_00130 [Candidatus Micrarchaeota archaeon]